MAKAAVFLVVMLAAAAHGLHCWVCNSEEDPVCADEFKAESKVLMEKFNKSCDTIPSSRENLNIDISTAFCRKSKMYLTGEERVHRDCGYMRREGYDCYQQRADDHVVDVCQCDDELCNAATVPSVTTTSLLTATFVTFLAARLNC